MGPDLESRLSHSSSSRSPLTLPITVCSGATATSMWVCLGVFLLACVLARVGVCKGAFHACVCVFFCFDGVALLSGRSAHFAHSL